jgi:hypothetical protein
MRPWACAGGLPAPWSAEATAATAIIVTEVPARRTSASVAIAEATTATISITKPAATTAARLGSWRWTVELKLCGHCLAAVLREIEGETLAFGQRLDARFRQSRDVDENICPAAVW